MSANFPASNAEPSGPVPGRSAVSRARRRSRRLRLTAQIAALSLIAGGVSGFVYLHKTVTLEVDGATISASTLAGTVGEVLAEQNVAVSEHDLVAPDLTASVPRNGEIVVRRAQVLDLEIDGALRRVWTTEPTVEQALAEIGVRADDVALSVSRSSAVSRLDHPVAVMTPKTLTVIADGNEITDETTAATIGQALSELGVVLEESDQVSESLDAPANDGQTVTVTRAVAKDGKKTVTTKFKTIKKDDPTLLKGEEKVVQKGRVGERIIAYTATVVGDEETDRQILTEVLVSEPQDKIIKVGTKEPPKPKVSKGSVPSVSIKVSPSSAKGIARTMVKDDDQFRCLVALWDRESGWRVNATNSYSGAYGIPQSLPGSKMASAGSDWRTNPATQIKWGLGYIKGRYGSPCGAWSAFQSKGWY